uniref:Uncharacterized protein n=1 Tax=Cucumis melo TaxID=3656 RepID=A0A9I9EC98_CUCME
MEKRNNAKQTIRFKINARGCLLGLEKSWGNFTQQDDIIEYILINILIPSVIYGKSISYISESPYLTWH